MKKRGVFLLLAIVSLVSLGIVLASPLTNDLHLNIQVTYSNGTADPGVYNFVFNITNDTNCSNILYSNSAILVTDPNGVVSYYLPNVNLPFNQQYYLCYYRSGSLISTIELGMSPYAYTAETISPGAINLNITTAYLSLMNQTSSNIFYINGTNGNVEIGT